MPKFQVTKVYGHERGFSCAFRQWRAPSHCRHLHGYALSFAFVFEAESLDSRNWVIDFGGLKDLERRLQFTFDHTVAVALDDPEAERLKALGLFDFADVVFMPAVGCEAFAQRAADLALAVIDEAGQQARVRLVSCTVAEHGSNSATFIL